MKYIILKLFFMILVLNLQSQSDLLLIQSNDGLQRLILQKSDNNTIDTIAGFAFKVELLDYKIYSETDVAYIVKSRIGYQYFRSKKINNKWIDQPQCGDLARNIESLSFIPPDTKNPFDSTFKIVSDDLVEYR